MDNKKFLLFIGGLFLIGAGLFFLSGCESESNADPKDITDACTGKNDKMAINPDNDSFPQQMDKCASPSWGNAEKTAACLREIYKSLSDRCAACFGRVAQCTAKNCKLKCMFGHFSDECLSCVNSHCQQKNKDNSFSLFECTGLNASQLPPSK
jgi:hypothetical protein